MSNKRRRTAEKLSIVPPGTTHTAIAVEDRPDRSPRRWWMFLAGVLLTLFVAFEVYGPALNGAFLFDDEYLPFMIPDVQNAPLRAWLGVRPFLMISYWLNYTTSGLEPYPYHAVNVVLHAFNAILVWAIVRRLLGYVGETGAMREILAVFSGALFLLHPAQTESVAYVTSRSEGMSVFFFLAAYAVFVYRPQPAISLLRSIVVLFLFGAAATSKEHTVVLPALLLLTDYFFTTPFRLDGIKRNAKLYVPIVVGGLLGLVGVWRVLSSAQTAGFQVKEFTWYQYLFTQFRVIWTYLRLYVLPVNLNGDYEYPVSHTITEHGAILALAGLVVLLVLAWRYRREYPLVSFGFIGFLLLLAPTSSVVPIRDVIVERRLYLPFICLLAATVGVLRRWRPSTSVIAPMLGLLLVVCAFGTYTRAAVWGSPMAFWSDTVQKSPNNSRANFQLAYAQWLAGNCNDAIRGYEKVAQLEKPDDRLLIDWALALDCANKPDEAVAKLRQAAQIAPSAMVHAQIGMIYGKAGRADEAMSALSEAEKLDPRFEMTFVYRGNVELGRGDVPAAIANYRHALAINPTNETAQRALAMAEQRQQGR